MEKTYLKQFPLQSRTNVIAKAKALRHFTFAGYLEQVTSDVHIIRFTFIVNPTGYDFRVPVTKDFTVTECAGYLRAVALDGSYSFAKLI